MASFTFSLIRSPKKFAELQHELSNFSDHPISEEDTITTEFFLEIDESFSANSFYFLHTEIDFMTDDPQQILVIDARQMKSASQGRFEIVGIGCTRPRTIKKIRIQDRSPNWDAHKIDDMLPFTPDQIMIHFNIKRRSSRFGLFLEVVDTAARQGEVDSFDCDPQVGNDPP